MATRHKESVSGKEKRGVPPMSSTTPADRRSPRLSTPPGTNVAKDHGKAPAASSTAGEPRKHVPNYLKPTISSNPDAAKHSGVRKHAIDDSHKPTPTIMRRRSFDRPMPVSQVQRTVQSSGSRGERTTPFSPKHSASTAVTRPSSSASERVSKVVKAMKSHPPLLKTTKSMPRTSSSSSSGVKKEAKTSNLKKPTPSTKGVKPSMEEEPVHALNGSEAEDDESLDFNVEEELAKMESPVDIPPPEKHITENNEHIDDHEDNQSPNENEDENKETLNSVETAVLEDHHDEHDHSPEPVTENTENIEVTTHEETQVADDEDTQVILVETQAVHEEIQVVHEDTQAVHEETQVVHEDTQVVHEDTQVVHEDTQAVHETQYTDENDQHSIQAVNEAPAEDYDTKEKEEEEEEAIEEINPAGLTVKTTTDEKDDETVTEEQGHHDSEGGEEEQNPKEEAVHKTEAEQKPADFQAENVVHKRQVGGLRNKKESPAYNDVIEETASRLVGKRVNKVRALAGAFETVISLQQPDSS